MGFKLDWRGDKIAEMSVGIAVAALTEFGARVETSAKSQLKPGRGVVTGTYRRSIHYASPGYNYAADDVKPSPATPERSGTGGGAVQTSANVVSIVVGSGLKYARRVEQLYATIQKGQKRVEPQLPTILRKHAKKAGFK